MNLCDIIDFLSEAKYGKGKDKSTSPKARAKTYASISQALADGSYGDIFSTKTANRLYVITKAKWGKKSGHGKVAKGFTPGSSTPSSDFSSVKKHAARTRLRYDPKGASKSLARRYGSRSLKKKFGVK